MAPPLRLASAANRLAAAHAARIADALRAAHPELRVELVSVADGATHGMGRAYGSDDPGPTSAAAAVAALRNALVERTADVAVHAASALSLVSPSADGSRIRLAAVPARDDPREVLVAREASSFAYLPEGSTVGVTHPRRVTQLARRRADLVPRIVPSDIADRLTAMDSGEVDALILAAADLKALGLGERLREHIGTRQMLPGAGQGGLALEVRADDDATAGLLAPLHDERSAFALHAERACMIRLGADTRAAIGVYAVTDGETLFVHGFVGDPASGELSRLRWQGPFREAESVGSTLAELLLAAGGQRYLPGAAPPPRLRPGDADDFGASRGPW